MTEPKRQPGGGSFLRSCKKGYPAYLKDPDPSPESHAHKPLKVQFTVVDLNRQDLDVS